ncbi:MAG TPA: undecaprenyl-phosphate glucose phosphotransferase [Rhodocyclaceae bacterium]|jgi:putative colanic acid biosynthesis UDP-glucose lipid carrier transferase|nr:undecaprenyl-phosphate glucose phosphotransferase [Rhodocyclaceae bacterium]
MPAIKLSPAARAVSDLYIGRDHLTQLVEALLEPTVLMLTIWGLSFWYEGELSHPYFILSLLVFALLFPGKARMQESLLHNTLDILASCYTVAALLLLLGYATDSLSQFPSGAIFALLWLMPAALMFANFSFRWAMPALVRMQGIRRRAIIVGLNEQGAELSRRIAKSAYDNIDIVGFFDDRPGERITASSEPICGRLSDIPAYVKEHHIQLIYLCLPMASQPRILAVLDGLRDTTASIYFVPDFFVTDIIQGRMTHVARMPVVSVCETPFIGVNRAIKRTSDIVISLGILTLISPILLAVAIAVKLTSPGSIIFKQRRYGLDGEEILVYKFRSMKVCEDGAIVKQAQKNDSRLTPIGGFLRKTSLDELPQFINVLQGRMSIVGPRPHAIAHNEMYRKLIKGYMVRHKAKPGITGWAQVNGLRGETETVDKMAARIEYDIDYLRNWSLILDLKIILMTVGVVFKDQYAY